LKGDYNVKIGVIGTGRMGRILAARVATRHEVVLYDSNIAGAQAVAATLELKSVSSLAEMDVDAVVLAVPDSEVASCLEALRETPTRWNVFSIATNISREVLTGLEGERVRCLNAKIIGHAGEMERGAKPVIVVDAGDTELIAIARQIFDCVGSVTVGEADQVKLINRVATEEALKTAVAIEKLLKSAGIVDAKMVWGALAQVAPGVLKAYSEDDLGPFAREIVKGLNGDIDK
jgi:3-hydroxyisobutyrate dehydrogenase-like beta-hydroxyacid dehydrogenase